MDNKYKSSTSGAAAGSNDGITPDGQQFSSSLQESMKEGVQIVELKTSDVMSPFVTMFSDRGHLVIENRAGKSYKGQLKPKLPLVIVKPESDDSFSYKLKNFKAVFKKGIGLQKNVPIILVGCNDREAKNFASDMGSFHPVYNVLRHNVAVPLDIGSIFSGSTENELQVSMGGTGVLHYSPNSMSEPIKVAETLTIPNNKNRVLQRFANVGLGSDNLNFLKSLCDHMKGGMQIVPLDQSYGTLKFVELLQNSYGHRIINKRDALQSNLPLVICTSPASLEDYHKIVTETNNRMTSLKNLLKKEDSLDNGVPIVLIGCSANRATNFVRDFGSNYPIVSLAPPNKQCPVLFYAPTPSGLQIGMSGVSGNSEMNSQGSYTRVTYYQKGSKDGTPIPVYLTIPQNQQRSSHVELQLSSAGAAAAAGSAGPYPVPDVPPMVPDAPPRAMSSVAAGFTGHQASSGGVLSKEKEAMSLEEHEPNPLKYDHGLPLGNEDPEDPDLNDFLKEMHGNFEDDNSCDLGTEAQNPDGLNDQNTQVPNLEDDVTVDLDDLDAQLALICSAMAPSNTSPSQLSSQNSFDCGLAQGSTLQGLCDPSQSSNEARSRRGPSR